jgi:hypothetical protein
MIVVRKWIHPVISTGKPIPKFRSDLRDLENVFNVYISLSGLEDLVAGICLVDIDSYHEWGKPHSSQKGLRAR